MAKKIMERLPKDSDLIDQLEKMAGRHNITRGSVTVIGALQKTVLSYYSQVEKKYLTHVPEGPMELLSGVGNISLKNGSPFVHIHLMVSDPHGRAFGGHAMNGCSVFAAEVIMEEIPGEDLNRSFDSETGLFLWPLK